MPVHLIEMEEEARRGWEGNAGLGTGLVLRCFYKKWVSKKAELKNVFGKYLKTDYFHSFG